MPGDPSVPSFGTALPPKEWAMTPTNLQKSISSRSAQLQQRNLLVTQMLTMWAKWHSRHCIACASSDMTQRGWTWREEEWCLICWNKGLNATSCPPLYCPMNALPIIITMLQNEILLVFPPRREIKLSTHTDTFFQSLTQDLTWDKQKTFLTPLRNHKDP